MWTIAAALNKSMPALERLGLKLQSFNRNKTEMTELFVQTIQDIHFLGVTVRSINILFNSIYDRQGISLPKRRLKIRMLLVLHISPYMACTYYTRRVVVKRYLNREHSHTNPSRAGNSRIHSSNNDYQWFIAFPTQGEVAFFSDGDRYDGMVEILQQHPGNLRRFINRSWLG